MKLTNKQDLFNTFTRAMLVHTSDLCPEKLAIDILNKGYDYTKDEQDIIDMCQQVYDLHHPDDWEYWLKQTAMTEDLYWEFR